MAGGEKLFENKVKKYLESKGCWFVKYFANSYTKSGVPDLLCNVNGYFVAIEVKASNGHPSELQIYNRDKIRQSGGIAIILYPEQFEDFKNLVKQLLDGYDQAFYNQYTFDERR